MAPLDLRALLLGWAVPALEIAAALIIIGGGAATIVTWARRRNASEARHQFSEALLVAPDFTIGADMLKLAVAPDLTATAVAAGVTAVRIALTFTLLHEVGSTATSSRAQGPR